MSVRWVGLSLLGLLCISGCAEDLQSDAAAAPGDEAAQGASPVDESPLTEASEPQVEDELTGVPEGTVEPDPIWADSPSAPPTPPACATAVISPPGSSPWRPLATVQLSGEESSGTPGVELAYTWSLVQPQGSYQRLQSEGQAAHTTFVPRMVGTYEVVLTVEGSDGLPSCGPATTVIEVKPGPGIHIEMVWDTPEDPDQSDPPDEVRRAGPPPGADLDLHFAHPNADSWFDYILDCFWMNKEPDWADKTAHAATYSVHSQVTDDPALTLEDDNGAGPEIITLERPEEDAVYYVGVHYWDDNGYGLSDAQVRVYLDGELSYTSQWVNLEYLDMWEVATLDWSNREVVSMTNSDGGPIVIPSYTNSFLFKIRCSLGLPITPSWLPNQ